MRLIKMLRYKIRHLNPASIILILLFLPFFSCKITKNVPEGKELIVKNKIIIENKDFNKKAYGFSRKEINQILKPKPNSKIFYAIPLKLIIYNTISDAEAEKKKEKKKERCIKKKNQKLSYIKKRLRYYDKKTENLSSESRKYKHYAHKLSVLQNKADKVNSETCDKDIWSRRNGEAPVILNINDKYTNQRRIRIFLKEKGFYNHSLKIEKKVSKINHKKVKLFYHLKLQKVHKINRILYDINDEKIKKIIFGDSAKSFLKKGKNLDLNLLENERERISDLLRNNGYYNFSKDYVRFSADTIRKNNNDDLFIIIKKDTSSVSKQIFKRYIVKNVFIYSDFDAQKALTEKERYFLSHDTLIYYSKNDLKYYLLYDRMPRINPKAVIRGVYIKPGFFFNLNDVNATYRYLTSLPIIRITDIKFSQDKSQTQSDTLGYLKCEIRLTQSKLQSVNASFELTNTSGNFGTGGTFFYTHNNFFRGTEVFNLGTKIAFKRLTKNKEFLLNDSTSFFNSREYGINFSLKFPRLMAPVPMKKFFKRRNPKTVISGNYNFLKRPDYTYTLAGGNIGYYWNSTNFINHSFIPLTTDIVDLRNATDEFLKLIKILRLEDTYETHFVLGSSYRFLLNNQFVKNKKNILYLTLFTKLAGNSLSAFMKYSDKPKTNGSYTVNNIVFAQFVKEEAELRFYRKLSRENDKLAFRIFAGAALPYGNLKVMPFGERYYVGGANSMRAWQNRVLGPGSYTQNDSIKTFPNQTADIRLEANAEYRHKLFGKLEGALFIDAGNIWAINDRDIRPGAKFNFNSFYKEIALGTGYGLRYDLSFVLLRIDMGIKLIDPSLPLNHRWIYGNRKFGYDDWTLYFAIGYPF